MVGHAVAAICSQCGTQSVDSPDPGIPATIDPVACFASFSAPEIQAVVSAVA
jgi:hypothetical protein